MNTPSLADILQAHKGRFAPVVPFNPEADKLLPLDFTAANTALTDEILLHTDLFSQYITDTLQKGSATYGIGGYNEHRTIYNRSKVFGPQSFDEEGLPYVSESGAKDAPLEDPAGPEPRRLHLGVDIWGPAGTPIYAPLEGTVHSFAFNDAYGDYGATLILQHELDGVIFHTLYGHLSLHSIEDKREGQDIAKGDWIAAFGEPAENGQWPPHLHFQVIQDMRGMKGDFPGVCKFSERETYLANGPDADLILGMVRYAGLK